MTDPTLLYEAVLTNHTPAMIGGANRGWINIDGSIDYPRPTDIAGKTRWWLRAILAGGIYEQYGYTPPINKLDEIAGEIMGKIKPAAQASKITIELRPENLEEYKQTLLSIKTKYRNQLCKLAHKHNLIDKPFWPRIHNHCLQKLIENDGECPEEEEACCALASPRVLLTVMGRGVDEAVGLLPVPPGKLRLKLRIRKRLGVTLSREEEELIGMALGLALYASGIGKAQTRGYGKLKRVSAEDKDNNVYSRIEEVYELLQHPRGLETIIEKAVEATSRYIEGNRDRVEHILSTQRDGPTSSKLPKAYTLHKELVKLWSSRRVRVFTYTGSAIECLGCTTDRPWCTVAAINIAVLKTTMKIYLMLKRLVGNNVSIRRLHGYPLITMYLGMERGSSKKNKTGYLFTSRKISRLISPMFFIVNESTANAVLFRENEAIISLEKDGIVVYYGKVDYYGRGVRPTPIECLINIVRKCCSSNNKRSLCNRDIIFNVYGGDVAWSSDKGAILRATSIASLVARILGLHEIDTLS